MAAAAESSASASEIGFQALPEEALAHIFVFVPDECLKKCSMVCTKWRNIIKGQTLWRLKCLRTGRFVEDIMAPYISPINDWELFYNKAPYTRNLVKNCSGQDGLTGWNILSNGGDRWRAEVEQKPPTGADVVPNEVAALSNNKDCNFVTSYSWCTMEQVIDLLKEGVSPELLDSDAQPDIQVSEWYASRYDCGNFYGMSVTLLTEPILSEENTLDEFKFGPEEKPASHHWNQVEHVFSGYGPGLRYIRFYHEGKDNKYWAGHYGSKMAGAQVQLVFNKHKQTNKGSDSACGTKLETEQDVDKKKGDEA